MLFLLGSTGILYSHYYGAFFLAGLSWVHLLFIPKNRIWWRPVWLWVISLILFILQLGGFVTGVGYTQSQPWFENTLRAPAVISWIVYVLSNGLLRLPAEISILALFTSVSVVLIHVWRKRQHQPISRILFLTVTALTVFLWMVVGNELLTVMTRFRVNYFIALWPLCSLMGGWLVWKSRSRWRLMVSWFLGGFFIYGIWSNVASHDRYVFYEFLYRDRMNIAVRELERYGWQNDRLYVRGFQNYWDWRAPLFDRQQLDASGDNDFSWDSPESLRVWLLLAGEQSTVRDVWIEQVSSEFQFCRLFVDRSDIFLALFAQSSIHCPDDSPPVLRFGTVVELLSSDLRVTVDGNLVIDLLLHAEENTAMTAYSVAIHVFAAEGGAKVAQGDQGLWLGRYNPVRSEIDISSLTPGEYEVKIGLYNWQTLERLEGVDLTSGVTGNLLPLSRFQIE